MDGLVLPGNNFCTTGSDLDLCLHVPAEVIQSSGGGGGGGNNRRNRQKEDQKKQLVNFINKLGDRYREAEIEYEKPPFVSNLRQECGFSSLIPHCSIWLYGVLYWERVWLYGLWY